MNWTAFLRGMASIFDVFGFSAPTLEDADDLYPESDPCGFGHDNKAIREDWSKVVLPDPGVPHVGRPFRNEGMN